MYKNILKTYKISKALLILKFYGLRITLRTNTAYLQFYPEY